MQRFARDIVASLVMMFVIVGAATASPINVGSGGSFTVNYNGFSDVNNPLGTSVAGLSAQAVFSGFAFSYDATNNLTNVTFNIKLTNTSTSPVTSSRISIMGFDTTPNIAPNPSPHTDTVSGTGGFAGVDTVKIGGNFPYNIGNVEFCFSAVNCAGGASNGVTMVNNPGFLAVSLWLAGGPVTSMTFDNMYVKYQDVSFPGVNGASYGGAGTSAVPEPASMILLGSGLSALGIIGRRKIRK